MNTKNNQRYQQTQAVIIAVFIDLLKKKALNKITVSEICKLSDINRTTFYLHYLDIYDLMEKTEKEMSTQIGSIFTAQNDLSIGERFILLFEFILTNRDFYTAFLNHAHHSSVINFLLPEGAEVSLQNIIHEFGYPSMEIYQYHQSFFLSGLTAVIRLWLSGGCKETPAQLLQIIDDQYHPKKTPYL